MNYKKIIIGVAFLFLELGGVHAQEAVTTIGSEATGAGGIVSYSVGQVFYTTNTEVNGSVAQGVQQAFEVSTTVGINEATINIELSIYPNPTINDLTLKVDKIEGLSFQLFDLQGKVITSKTINGISTDISLEDQPASTYFLNVVKNNQLVKTFKIIKN